MDRLLYIFLVVFLLAFSQEGRAQKTKRFKTFKPKAQKAPKNKGKAVCPIFEESEYPYHGVGLKLGDPSGVTYKFYATQWLAFALDVGKGASGLYSTYHRDHFSDFIALDTLIEGESITYLAHRVKRDLVGAAKVLLHQDVSSILPGLQLYLGAGWQIRNVKLEYEYLVERDFNEAAPGTLLAERTFSGLVGSFGLEYAYFEIPVSAFMEVEVFSDAAGDPGWTRLQGGVGLRYVF